MTSWWPTAPGSGLLGSARVIAREGARHFPVGISPSASWPTRGMDLLTSVSPFFCPQIESGPLLGAQKGSHTLESRGSGFGLFLSTEVPGLPSPKSWPRRELCPMPAASPPATHGTGAPSSGWEGPEIPVHPEWSRRDCGSPWPAAHDPVSPLDLRETTPHTAGLPRLPGYSDHSLPFLI